MNFIKKYKCPKCGHSFSKMIVGSFLKGVMPQCPVCGGNEAKIENRVEKEKEK